MLVLHCPALTDVPTCLLHQPYTRNYGSFVFCGADFWSCWGHKISKDRQTKGKDIFPLGKGKFRALVLSWESAGKREKKCGSNTYYNTVSKIKQVYWHFLFSVKAWPHGILSKHSKLQVLWIMAFWYEFKALHYRSTAWLIIFGIMIILYKTQQLSSCGIQWKIFTCDLIPHLPLKDFTKLVNGTFESTQIFIYAWNKSSLQYRCSLNT